MDTEIRVGSAVTLKDGQVFRVRKIGHELILVEKWISRDEIAGKGIRPPSDPDFTDAWSHVDRIGDRMEQGEGRK